MRYKTRIHIPSSVRALLEPFDDDYLADALRLWDCYEKNWMNNRATVLRFENDDLLLWKEADLLRCKRGSVETLQIEEFALNLISNGAEDDFCPCWRHDKEMQSFIGRNGVSAQLLEHLRKRYELTDCDDAGYMQKD